MRWKTKKLVFNLKGKFREYLKYIGLKKYKDAGILLTQLLDAPQLIPTKYKEFIILELADLLPKVSCYSIKIK